MAVYQIDKKYTGIEVGLWNLIESKEELIAEAKSHRIDISSITNFTRNSRISQWIAARLLLNHMIGKHDLDLYYDDFGKPHFRNLDLHLSISHSNNFIAAIINEKYPTGIDIERLNPKVLRIKERFLSDSELKQIDSNNEIAHLIIMWAAKESIYKAFGRKELNFKKNIRIHPFNSISDNKVHGALILDDKRSSFVMEFIKLKDFIMVYILNS